MSSQPMASVTRQLSRRSVFEALLHRSPISRAELAKVTGLSKQTTSEVIDAFEQQTLVRSVGRIFYAGAGVGVAGRRKILRGNAPQEWECPPRVRNVSRNQAARKNRIHMELGARPGREPVAGHH